MAPDSINQAASEKHSITTNLHPSCKNLSLAHLLSSRLSRPYKPETAELAEIAREHCECQLATQADSPSRGLLPKIEIRAKLTPQATQHVPGCLPEVKQDVVQRARRIGFSIHECLVC